jgi:hypothetical protein
MSGLNISDLQTGDLLLFNYQGGGFFSAIGNLIRWGTNSNYTHISMVLRDPVFIDFPPLKGLFVWESSYEGTKDPQDGKIKLGVQITPLEEVINNYQGEVYIRKLKRDFDYSCSSCGHSLDTLFTKEKLQEIHNNVYDKPYDIVPSDWIEAFFRKDTNPQKTDRFWCSALVGYIYTMVGILDKDTDWSILRPSDFSLNGDNLKFANENILEDSIKKIK